MFIIPPAWGGTGAGCTNRMNANNGGGYDENKNHCNGDHEYPDSRQNRIGIKNETRSVKTSN